MKVHIIPGQSYATCPYCSKTLGESSALFPSALLPVWVDRKPPTNLTSLERSVIHFEPFLKCPHCEIQLEFVIDSPSVSLFDSGGYDHKRVRCEPMADFDMTEKYPGDAATCCICIDHDCDAAKVERLKHPKS